MQSIYKTLLALLLLMICQTGWAGVIKGKVRDGLGEPLTGAHVTLDLQGRYAIVGLDGSYTINQVPVGQYQVEVSFIGFKKQQLQVRVTQQSEVVLMDFLLEPDDDMLEEIVVMGQAMRGSETEARMLERNALNTVNIVSAKAIELSPDISVANVVQRVSGLTVERNSAGDPQYAIVRGMDKRYNYTLVNGVKIPSPDNKNRYVPLDIFPASLLERLEVHKSLSPSFEGDALGGAVNMVMKSAPEQLEIRADVQGGYNHINTVRGFDRFNHRNVRRQSPFARFGSGYRAQPTDFSRSNLITENITPMPDLFATGSVGGRVFNNKLGAIVAATYQDAHRGTESIWFDYSLVSAAETLTPNLDKLDERDYSARQIRTGLHTNIDYRLSKGHTLKLYSGFYMLNEHQTRLSTSYRLGGGQTNPASGNAEGVSVATRTRMTLQNIYNTTLSGTHQLTNSFSADWSAVYSLASNDRPDNAQFQRVTELRDFVFSPERIASVSPRRWESNTDEDYTLYLNFRYQPGFFQDRGGFRFGGMYRTKERQSFYTNYNFSPSFPQTQGVHWETYADVQFNLLNPQGSPANELNYDAHEDILAYYLQLELNPGHWQITTGARVEHTDQSYSLRNPVPNVLADTAHIYMDVMPSLHLKYQLDDAMHLRGSYFYSISRPGFFELVPYSFVDEDYRERGNPNLQRVRAHNLDVRWEYYPRATDQILLGLFYKNIMDPIEYALVPFGTTSELRFQPNNFGTAVNWGVELDYSRFFNKVGVRANYTFTDSRLEAVKTRVVREIPSEPASQLVTQSLTEVRPLQGQARHIANVSLLYKNIQKGTDAQVAFVYTGERLEAVSPFYQNDSWALPILQIDLSVEQRIGQKFQVFLKANNIHNAPYRVVVKGTPRPGYENYPHQDQLNKYILIRRDQYFQSLRIGARWEL